MADPAVTGALAPTGVLRAAINLGNPVLAQGTPEQPSGVTVDIAREAGRRLGVEVVLHCFDAARKSFEALATGSVDLSFLAIEPAREKDVAFSAPYVVIEGVYAVPTGSDLHTVADVDADGVRIAVNQGSAYDLFLTRTLQHATLVRTDPPGDVDVLAGIRQPLAAQVADRPDLRLIDERFMEIRQAVGIAKTHDAATASWVAALVEELKANGAVAASLRAAGQDPELAQTS